MGSVKPVRPAGAQGRGAPSDAVPAGRPEDSRAPADALPWSASLDRADQESLRGMARPVLRLAAMLDPEGIPESVLTAAPAVALLAELLPPPVHRRWRRPTPPPTVSDQSVLASLRTLHRHHLIDYTPDVPHRAVRLDPPVGRAVRDTLTPGEHGQYARAAADALLGRWPRVERDTDLARALRANTAALAEHAEDALFGQAAAHEVLFRAGTSLGDAGQSVAAVDHFGKLAAVAARRFGPDDHGTLRARHLHAMWSGETGDAVAAAETFERLLADCVRVLGPDHPDTLAARLNRARWLGASGDPGGAVAAGEELLAEYLRLLGRNHSGTLAARQNLARWRAEAGDPARAVADLEDLQADYFREMGPNDPLTLNNRQNLAVMRGEAGDQAGAAEAFEQLLADYVRALGPDHPSTLTTRIDQARHRGLTGDPAGAAAALDGILADCLRLLGSDHPYTLAARANLDHFRR